MLLEKAGEYTIGDVRKHAKTDANLVSRAVRLFRAGKMPPLWEAWGVEGAVPRRPKGQSTKNPAAKALADQSSSGESHQQLKDEFSAQVEAAETDEDREKLSQRLIVLGTRGVYTHQELNAFKGLLQQATSSAKAKREVPKEDPERVYLVSPDGALILQAFERICGEDRRLEVLEFAKNKLEEDAREMPSVDPVGAL